MLRLIRFHLHTFLNIALQLFVLETYLAYLKGHELALAQEPHLDEDSSIAASPVRDVKRHKLPV